SRPSPSPLFLLSFLSPLSSPSSPFPSLLFFLSLSFSFLSFFSSSSFFPLFLFPSSLPFSFPPPFFPFSSPLFPFFSSFPFSLLL
ncbi:hypothetical protein ACXWRW_10710, partial [Streptococcus pyogenes]